MKFTVVFLFFITLFTSCAINEQKLLFKTNSHEVAVEKNQVIAAEHGKDVVGNTRVIITISPDGLTAINSFLAQNINKNMDIMYGDHIISKSVPIRTDHFLADIIIPFKDNELAKKFYSEFGQTKKD